MKRVLVPDMDRAVTVYRLFAADGELLYVGQTVNFESRLARHLRELSQDGTDWPQRVARWEMEVHGNRQLAVQAERLAILRECPTHNLQVTNPWAVGLPMRRGNTYDLVQLLRVQWQAGDISIHEVFRLAREAGVTSYRTAHWLGLENNRSDPFRRVFRVSELLELNGVVE